MNPRTQTKQALANLSRKPVADISMKRLAPMFAKQVVARREADLRNEREAEDAVHPSFVDALRAKAAKLLEAEAENTASGLPVSSIYDALQITKRHKKASTDAGIRALRGMLTSMWKASRDGDIDAEAFMKYREHFGANFPKSAVTDVFEEIGAQGYAALPVSDLLVIASRIYSQADYDYEMQSAGLTTMQPHHVKSRRFILAVITGEEETARPFDQDEAEPGMDVADWLVNRNRNDMQGGDPEKWRAENPPPKRAQSKFDSELAEELYERIMEVKMSKLSNIASRLLSRNESKLAYEVLALDSLSDSQQVANEVKYAKEWLDVLNQVFQQLEDTGEGQYLTKAKRAFEAIDPSLRKLKAVLQEWEDKATEDGDPSVVQEEWDDIAWEEDASSLIESWINGNRGDVAQACLADPDMAEDVFAGLSPEDQNGLRRRMDMERTGRRQADSGDLIQKQLGDYVQGGDWSPDPSGGRSTFISGEEDMSWLRSEHLPGLSDEFLSAIIEGNEDSPDSIEVYWAEDPTVADTPVIYVRAGEEFEDFDVEGGRQAY